MKISLMFVVVSIAVLLLPSCGGSDGCISDKEAEKVIPKDNFGSLGKEHVSYYMGEYDNIYPKHKIWAERGLITDPFPFG